MSLLCGVALASALREFEPVAKEMENEKSEVVQIGDAELAALLGELKPLLEKGGFGAMRYVGKLQGIAGMEALEARIGDYDFMGALQIMESL